MRQPAAEAAAGEIQLVIDQARHSLDTSLDHSDDPHGPVIQMRHGQQFHAVALVSDGDALQRHLGAAAAEPAEPGFVSNRLDVGCQAAPRHGRSRSAARSSGVVIDFIEGCGAAKAATEGVLALPRWRRSASVQPGDQRRQELAQHRRPFGVLGAAGGMAEIAVELEITRLDTGRGQGLDDIGRDLWWKQRVGAA